MKTTSVKRIFTQITEDAMAINERARKKGRESDVIYNMTINTVDGKKFEYQMMEDSNWDIEDDTLWLETNQGTQWIDTDKIASIEI